MGGWVGGLMDSGGGRENIFKIVVDIHHLPH